MTNQSTKYRKFLAGAASATLVATAIVPTVLAEEVETAAADFSDVAASHTHYAAIMQAVERGLFDGYKDGTFKPENSIDRKGVVKSLAKYVISQSEHKTFEEYIAANKLAETVAPFNDVPATHGDTELFNASLIVKDSGIFRGSNNNLMPANNITRQQMAQVLVKGFGLKDLAEVESTVTDTDKAQAQYVDFINILSENGVTAVTTFNPTTDVKRGQMASFLNRSFDVAHPEVVDPTPEVVSVSAINLKQVEVKFNNEVDETTAETVANYTLTGGLAVASAEANGESVVLTLSAAAAQQANVELTVENVKDTNEKLAEKTTKAVKFFDSVAPKTSSVEAVAPRTLKVTFSEPLQSAPTFKLDNGTFAVVNASWSVGDSEAVLTLGTDLAEGSHSLEVAGGTDYANFAIEKASTSFTFVKDVVAPTVTVKSADETKVVLEFSEEVTNLTDANVKFYHTFKTAAYAGTVASVDGKEVTLNFTNPLPTGNSKLFVDYVADNGTMIQDASGNKLAEQELVTNVVADATAPTVTKVEAKSNTQIDVTFSEDINGGTTAANYTLKDAAGDAVALTGTVTKVSGNTYRVATSAPLNGGSYTLAVKNVTDTSVRANKIVDFSTTVAVKDEVAPTIATAAKISATKVKLTFSEVMDANSVTTKSNFRYDSEALGTNDTIELADSNKAVIITIAGGVDDSKDLTVGQVKDAAGNFIKAFSTNQDIIALSNVGVSKVEVTGKNSIKLTIDQVITDAQVSDFKYTLDDTVIPAPVYVSPTAISTSVVDGQTYITLTTADIADTTAANIAVQSVKADGNAGATANAKNAFSTPVEFAATAATDKYSASILGATFASAIGDTDSIAVTFSEDLYAASVQESDFQVEGYVITAVSVAGDVVTLTVKDNAAASATPKVKLVGQVEDVVRNVTNGPLEVTSN